MSVLEEPPGRNYGRLVPVVLVDADLVVGLADVKATEVGGALDMLCKGLEGRDRVAVCQGLAVEHPLVPGRSLGSVFFRSQMQGRSPGLRLAGVHPLDNAKSKKLKLRLFATFGFRAASR